MRKNKLIKELVHRRDEVIKRAQVVARGKLPDWLLELQLPDTIKWIIDPLILRKYKPYKTIKNESERTAIKTAYSLMDDYEKASEEERKEKGSN